MLGVMMLSLVACSGEKNDSATKKEGSAASWSITIEGTGKDPIKFTNGEAEKVGIATQKASMKDKDTSLPEQEWQGVLLGKVLDYYGIKSYTTVKVESQNGSSKEYTPDLVASSAALLGWKVDGKALDSENGPVQLVVNGKGSNWWIKNVSKITIVK